jgi:hypothetical protein
MIAALPASADSGAKVSNAAANSAEASAELTAEGAQLALGAVAVPLAAAGATFNGVGDASGEVAAASRELANKPLDITDDVVIAVAPHTFAPGQSAMTITTTAVIKKEER